MPARPWSLLVNGVIADDTLDAAVVTLCGDLDVVLTEWREVTT